MTRPIVLFFAPSMQAFAEKMQAISEDICGRRIELGEAKFPRFGDGWTHPIIKEANKLHRYDVTFAMSLDDEAAVFRQFSAAQWVAERGPHSFKMMLLYYPTATMERGDTEDDVATAHSLASQYELIPQIGRPNPLLIADAHTLSLENMLPKKLVSVRFVTAMNMLQAKLNPQTTGIVWPDLGAKKRFESMFKDKVTQKSLFRFVSCEKVRTSDNEDRKVTVLEGDPSEFEEVMIVDDLTHSGKTLVRCKEALTEHCIARGKRVPRISTHVSHLALEPGALERIRQAEFSRFSTTDSCPLPVQEVAGDPLFEVMSLTHLAVEFVVCDIDGIEIRSSR